MKDDDYLESKYRKIISKLLVEHPYYGAILSSMKVHESEDAYRIFPNGNNIMVNREWFTNAAPEECKFELSKVAVKISLLQESRMKNRLPLIWNLAMESVSESILSCCHICNNYRFPKGNIQEGHIVKIVPVLFFLHGKTIPIIIHN